MTLKHIFLACMAGFLFWNGCSAPNELESQDAGRTVSYEAGIPNFDMEVIPTWRDDASGIDLYIGLPYRSLIFLQQGGKYFAKYDAVVRVYDEKGKTVLKEETWNEDVTLDEYATTQTIDAIAITKRFAVAPGEYIVEVSLEDGNSRKEAIRKQKISVQDLKSGSLSVSRVLLEGRKRTNKFEPITAYHIGAETDSLRASIEVYNADSAPRLDVVMILRSMATDRLPALPPYWFSPSVGSLTYQGIQFNKLDTLQVSRKSLSNLGSEAFFEFNLPRLRPNTYRIDITVTAVANEGANKVVLQSQTRFLSIKTPGFPRVETLTQLIEPLVYITSKKEFEAMAKKPTEAERQAEFERFWGERMPSRQAAANTLKEYYVRVEQANLLFSNYKEGWKTDQGMIYILMGAPVQVDRQFETEIWRYSFGSRDPLSSFVFQRVGNRAEESTMHFQLQRYPFYEQEWYRRIDRWRTGTAY